MANKGLSCLALTPDDKYIIGSAKSSLGVWDIDSGEAVQRFDNGSVVTCLAITSDGIHVVTGGDNGIVQVWRIANGAREKTFHGHEGDRIVFSFYELVKEC